MSDNYNAQVKKEERRVRFKKVAERRTNEIVDKIRIIGNTSNRSIYEYKQEEIDKIFEYIHKSLDIQKDNFTFSTKPTRELFKL
tara:strand:- start:114 stop:365 length:252 start_codon:yes stop_codon:yes gene_type:complete